jgi:hypothetical protein
VIFYFFEVLLIAGTIEPIITWELRGFVKRIVFGGVQFIAYVTFISCTCRNGERYNQNDCWPDFVFFLIFIFDGCGCKKSEQNPNKVYQNIGTKSG